MTHSPRPAFFATSGASRPKLVLVGEAWGESEDQLRKPFVGESGKELFRILGEAMPEVEPELHARICEQHRYGLAWVKDRDLWFKAAGIALTNVLALRPDGNKLETLCDTKKSVGEFAASFPPLAKGKYLKEEYLCELDRLELELATWSPNLVVPLGNTATWATLRSTNIGSIRGAVTSWSLGRASGKALPSYHPAGVLRQWAWRPIVVADLMKAARESGFAEIRRPARGILVAPTLAEVESWTRETLANPPRLLAPDIETTSGQITCIGFARGPSDALVVPFWNCASRSWWKEPASYNHWAEPWQERRAWDCVAALLESPIPKVFQNGLYDLQYIARLGIRPRACLEDTMLLHHSMYPELQKGLGFLGSIYTSEASWKLMRKRKADTEKKDE